VSHTRCCWHSYLEGDTSPIAMFCCRDGCKNVLINTSSRELEEKTHGGWFVHEPPRLLIVSDVGAPQPSGPPGPEARSSDPPASSQDRAG
jgi:hypothetical protein